MSILICD